MSKYSEGIRYYLLVGIVGLLAASAAIGYYLLYLSVWSFTQHALAYSIFILLPISFAAFGIPYFIVKRFAKTKTTGSGTHTVLEAYHLTNGEISMQDTFVKPTAAMLTIGLGGSAGPEGPSLLAGGGIASAISRKFKIQSDLQRRLFIAGAAAGLAATFRTPLTAILFALEIPYKNDLDRETFIEAVVASVPAYLLSVAILGSQPFFGVGLTATLTWELIGLSLLLGLICGLYAIFYTKMFAWTSTVSFRIKQKIGVAGLIVLGAVSLSICGFISLYTIGVGLNFTSTIISGVSISISLVIAIILLKTFLTSVTLNFGGSGGLFFPTIVVGAGIGYVFAHFFSVSYTVMFIAVGMAALLGGTHKILLTPVAFVVETLGGIFAIPALLANVVSYVVSGQYSFYSLQPRTRVKAEELALERWYVKAEKLVPQQMEKTTVNLFMTPNPLTLAQGGSVKEALDVFEGHKLRVLPVTDSMEKVVGVLYLEDLAYVDPKRQPVNLSETIMHKPTLISEQTSLKEAAQLMMEKQQDHLYVLDKDEKLIGVVSGIDIVKKIIALLS